MSEQDLTTDGLAPVDEDFEGAVEISKEDLRAAEEFVHVELEDDEASAEAEATLQDAISEQDEEAEAYAIAFMKKIIRLRGVRIDRDQYLTAELHKRGISDERIAAALIDSPAAAGLTPAELDEIADDAIEFETRKSTAMSFAAGLPGGFAMLGTVPADITQYYVHAFRVMQKLAYVYGWKSFLEETEDVDDETLGKLAAFFGVMLGVGGASASLQKFAVQVARPAIQKQIAGKALTKTVWYTPMKQTLRLIGVHVTKQSFAKTVTKVVPLIGGVVSGGLTYTSLKIQSLRLMKHLRELPPPNVDAEQYLAMVKQADEAAPDRAHVLAEAMGQAGSAIKGAASDAADLFRSVDLDGDGIPDEARALTAAKGAASAVKGAATSASDKLHAMDLDGDGVPDTEQAKEKLQDAGAAVLGAAAGAADKFGSFLRRRKEKLDKGAEPESGEDSED